MLTALDLAWVDGSSWLFGVALGLNLGGFAVAIALRWTRRWRLTQKRVGRLLHRVRDRARRQRAIWLFVTLSHQKHRAIYPLAPRRWRHVVGLS